MLQSWLTRMRNGSLKSGALPLCHVAHNYPGPGSHLLQEVCGLLHPTVLIVVRSLSVPIVCSAANNHDLHSI